MLGGTLPFFQEMLILFQRAEDLVAVVDLRAVKETKTAVQTEAGMEDRGQPPAHSENQTESSLRLEVVAQMLERARTKLHSQEHLGAEPLLSEMVETMTMFRRVMPRESEAVAAEQP